MNQHLQTLKYFNGLMIAYALYKLAILIKTTGTLMLATQPAHEGAALASFLLILVFGLFFVALTWLNFRSVRFQLRDGRPAKLKIVVLNSLWLVLHVIGLVSLISTTVKLVPVAAGAGQSLAWPILLTFGPGALVLLYLVVNIVNASRSRRGPTPAENVFA